MRARQLEVFTAVMRAGTVTAAARVLNISQPALSQILMHAEDELGFQLFKREKGRLHPTPEALEIYPEAERLFGGLEGLRRKTTDLKLGKAGLVRLAASTPPALALVPRVLRAFHAAHPDVLLRSHVAPLEAMIAMLRAGDTGLALALDDRLPADIAVEALAHVGFCCLLPEQDPRAVQDAVTFDIIAQSPLISYRSNTRPHDELCKAAEKQGAKFAPQIEIDTSISAVGLVQAGLGVAIVDDLLPWEQFHGICARPLRIEARLPLALLTLKGAQLSRSEEVLRKEVRAQAKR